MNKQRYTKRDFQICRILAIGFTISYCFCDIISWLMNVTKGSDTVKVMAVIGILSFPILILLSCYMCIERYWFLEFHSAEGSGCIQSRKMCAFSIGLILLLGVMTIYSAGDVFDYVALNWNMKDGLYECIVIEAGMAVVWLM